jgi:hypothetical protein
MVHETVVKCRLRLNQGPWNRAILRTIRKLSSWRKTKEPKEIICEKISDSYVTETKITLHINPLNAESNPICHVLVLLGDLTYMVPCIVSTRGI